MGLGCGWLTVGIWDLHVCVCVHARTDCGRCASMQFAPAAHFGFINAILSNASIRTNNQNVLEFFGGVDANSLCKLLNNNYDNDHPDDEPNIVQMSSYYDDDSLSNLFKDKGNSFCILSLNFRSSNGQFDQLNIKVQQLESNGHEFSAICLQEAWWSGDSYTPLFKVDGYNLILQGKICSSHGGLAI